MSPTQTTTPCILLLRPHEPDPERALTLAGALRPQSQRPPQLKLLLSPSTARGPERWAELVARMERAEAWGRSLGLGAPELLFELETLSWEPGTLCVLGALWKPEVALDLIRQGCALARPGAGPLRPPFTTAGAPFWRDPATTQGPMRWLKAHAPALQSLELLAVRERQPSPTTQQMQAILSLPFSLEIKDLVLEALPQLLVAELPAGTEAGPLLRLLSQTLSDPALLLLPASEPPSDLVASDLLLLNGLLLCGLSHVDALGRCTPAVGQACELFAQGQVLAQGVSTPAGLRLPAPQGTPEQLALRRDAQSPLLQLLRCVRQPSSPPALITLGQSSQAEAVWLLRFPGDPDPRTMAQQHPHAQAVLSAASLLPNGLPPDIPDEAREIVVLRIRRRLALAGLSTQGERGQLLPPPQSAPSSGLALSLERLCQAQLAPIEVLALQLHAATSRRDLLDHLAHAQERILLQTYIFQNDTLGHAVVQALLQAAKRGVAVRVLVDAIFGMENPLIHNPVLQPLLRQPGVRVRGLQAPEQIVDLKRRSHRKLLVVDQRVARVSGRNLGTQYYTGLEELPLSPETRANEVPWIDAGVDLRGPMLEHVAHAFEQAWAQAAAEPPPAEPVWSSSQLAHGQSGLAGLVLHQGLKDANTLEAQRLLIESAKHHITLVNTFPLQFELQSLLLERLQQGITVRFLVGNVRAQYTQGLEQRPFPGGAVRELATQIVHGRLDPLAKAGAHIAQAVVPNPGTWSQALDRVLPHVHAKVMSVDGVCASIGSANLDISAAYWESEAMLVLLDPAQVAPLDAWLDGLFEHARPFERDSPAWCALAEQRAAISRGWPSWMM